MMKIYTNELKAANEQSKSPKKSVLSTILNFSKSLEVITLKDQPNGNKNSKVELMLN
jgi:hypothetical protein